MVLDTPPDVSPTDDYQFDLKKIQSGEDVQNTE